MIQMRVSSNKSPALQILKKSRAHFSSVSHSTVRLKPKLAVTTQRVRSSTCSADHGPSPTHACLYHSILTTDYNKLCRALYMDTKGNTSILRVHCTSPSFFLSKKYQRTAMFNLHWATIGLNPFIYRKNHGASTEWTVSVCWFDGDRAAATPAPRINNVTASRDARKSTTTRAEQSLFINFLCVVARIESSCSPKWIIAKRGSEQLNIKQLYLFLEYRLE